MLAIAKITAKGQTTIPQDVRAALNVSPGDLIAWEVGTDGTAVVRRIQPMDVEYLRAVQGTLVEWAGAADEKAYRDFCTLCGGSGAVSVHRPERQQESPGACPVGCGWLQRCGGPRGNGHDHFPGQFALTARLRGDRSGRSRTASAVSRSIQAVHARPSPCAQGRRTLFVGRHRAGAQGIGSVDG